jgi:hypothetical protein
MSAFDPSFRFSCVSSSDALPLPHIAELLARVRAGPAWDEVSICRAHEQYPCLHLAWQADRGFIVHCFEDAASTGDFLVESVTFAAPEVEINLGGQALERWPPQLFVSDGLARAAVEFFLRTGKRSPLHAWVDTGGFPRETVWEGRDQRLAWESRRGSDV